MTFTTHRQRCRAVAAALVLAPAPIALADGWFLNSMERTIHGSASFINCPLPPGECTDECSDGANLSTDEDGLWSEAVIALCSCGLGQAGQTSFIGERRLEIETETRADSCQGGSFGGGDGEGSSHLVVEFTLLSTTTVIFRADLGGDASPFPWLVSSEVTLDGPVSTSVAVGVGEKSAVFVMDLPAGTYTYNVSVIAAATEWSGSYTNTASATASLRTLCDAADLNGDGTIDGADVGMLLGEWGSTEGAADLDADGLVGSSDLGHLLSAWGCS